MYEKCYEQCLIHKRHLTSLSYYCCYSYFSCIDWVTLVCQIPNGAYLFIYLFIYLFSFNGCTCSTWKFPGQEWNRSCSCQPTSQPEQCQIRTMPVTHAATPGNARSLTYWSRPGTELCPHGYQLGLLSLSHKENSPTVLFSNPPATLECTSWGLKMTDQEMTFADLLPWWNKVSSFELQ